MATFLAAAGEPEDQGEASPRASPKVGAKTFKVHVDGFNLLPYLTGEQ